MSGWRWFWTLVGFLVLIIVLIFLFFYQPFEDLFRLVVYGISFDNVIFWAALLIGILGFCAYHWRAYRVHIVDQQSVEKMVLSSLRGSTFVAILLSAGAALQAVQSLCIALLREQQAVAATFASGEDVVEIGTGVAADAASGTGVNGTSARRAVRIDGMEMRSQAALGEKAAALWLTPDMERLFSDGAAGRRRFHRAMPPGGSTSGIPRSRSRARPLRSSIAVATTLTRVSGSSLHSTGISLIRKPRRSAMTSSSVSKNQWLFSTTGTRTSAAILLSALNPHCASVKCVPMLSRITAL